MHPFSVSLFYRYLSNKHHIASRYGNASVNTSITEVISWMYECICRRTPRHRTAGWKDTCIYNFPTACQIALHRSLVQTLRKAIWHSLKKLIFTSLLSEKWYFDIDVICIYLILSEVEHIWMLFVFPLLWLFPYPFFNWVVDLFWIYLYKFFRYWKINPCSMVWADFSSNHFPSGIKNNQKEQFELLSQNIFCQVVNILSQWLWWWRVCLQYRRPRFNPWVGNILWRREWQPTPVFLPGEFHGQRSLAGYNPWDHKESDTTEWLTHTVKATFFCSQTLLNTSLLFKTSLPGNYYLHFTNEKKN